MCVVSLTSTLEKSRYLFFSLMASLTYFGLARGVCTCVCNREVSPHSFCSFIRPGFWQRNSPCLGFELSTTQQQQTSISTRVLHRPVFLPFLLDEQPICTCDVPLWDISPAKSTLSVTLSAKIRSCAAKQRSCEGRETRSSPRLRKAKGWRRSRSSSSRATKPPRRQRPAHSRLHRYEVFRVNGSGGRGNLCSKAGFVPKSGLQWGK